MSADIRVVLSFTKDEIERAAYHYGDAKFRNLFFKQAILKHLNFLDSRDKRKRQELLLSDAKRVQELIDKGLLRLPGAGGRE
jgi:hypothetical protein